MAADVQPMYVRLPVELHQRLRDRAVADDRSMASVIRTALRFYLREAPMSVGSSGER